MLVYNIVDNERTLQVKLDQGLFRSERKSKRALMDIAGFELESMELAMQKLGEVIQDRKAIEMIRVFVDVTDTFGFVYIQQGIASSRLKESM